MERRNDRDILRLLKDNKISDANKLLNKIILEQKEKVEEKPIKFSYFPDPKIIPRNNKKYFL